MLVGTREVRKDGVRKNHKLSKVFAQARVYRVRSSRERKTRVAHGDWRTGGTAAVSTSNSAAVRNGVPVQPGWATVLGVCCPGSPTSACSSMMPGPTQSDDPGATCGCSSCCWGRKGVNDRGAVMLVLQRYAGVSSCHQGGHLPWASAARAHRPLSARR